MARVNGKRVLFDIRPAIESMGLDRFIEQVGIDHIVEHLDVRAVINHIGIEGILANLSPAERQELKRRLQ